MWDSIQSFGVGGVVQILILACVFYYVFLFFRGTRGAQVLVGLILSLVILILLTQFFKLDALEWVLRKVPLYLATGLLVIFQPEIRRALAELGKQPVFTTSTENRNRIDYIVEAMTTLSEHKIGALVAVEREIGTRTMQEDGIKLDAPLVPELLASIFYPHTPLHDGGVIIKGNRIMAARCQFPLSHNTDLQKTLGMRHRAAVGMSEETDAVVIIVSEETGAMSVSYHGRLSRALDGERLKRFLSALLLRGRKEDSAWRRAQEQLNLTPEGIAQSENITGREGDHVS